VTESQFAPSAGPEFAREARDGSANGYGTGVADACVGPIYDFSNDMLKVSHVLLVLAVAPGV
jgi:hypothetical protein